MHICLFFCFVFLEIIFFFFFVRRNRYRKKRETELDTCVSSTYCRAACMLHAVVQFARTWILKRYNQETEAIPIAQKTLWTQLCSLFHVPQFGAECLKLNPKITLMSFVDPLEDVLYCTVVLSRPQSPSYCYSTSSYTSKGAEIGKCVQIGSTYVSGNMNHVLTWWLQMSKE